MRQGQVDFSGFDLYINTNGGGSIDFSDEVLNLNQMHYNQIAPALNTVNATFPFEDSHNGVKENQVVGQFTGR